MAERKDLSPKEGGCWFCRKEIPEHVDWDFSTELDTNFEMKCLQDALLVDSANPEARIIAREFGIAVFEEIELEPEDESFRINCTSKSGPVYGGKEIIGSGYGDFYVTDASGTNNEKLHGNRILIDGETTNALSIITFGFTLEDFEEVPINEYGYKEVARYKNEVLVVTANSLFVIYSGGLPSLQGLPSAVQVVSGPWVDGNDVLNLPALTLFDATRLSCNACLVMATTFRIVPTYLLDYIHWTKVPKRSSVIPESHLCNAYLLEELSRYAKNYPVFSEQHLSVYKNELSKEGKSLLNFEQLNSVTLTSGHDLGKSIKII